jgi:hypothetical protein
MNPPLLTLLLGAVLVASVATPRAAAGSELEAIRLAYTAPTSCPGVDAFEREVRRAAPRIRVTDHDEGGRLFTVSLENEPGPRGRLTIRKDGAVTGEREIQGTSCEEVASVLAFAVALAVDPSAIPPPRPGALVAAPANDATPTPSTPPRSPADAVPSASERASASDPSSSHRWWGLSIHALAASALAPNVSFGGGPSVDFGGKVGQLSPSLRVGLEYATSAAVTVDDASVTFADVLASIEGCPTGWELGRLSLRPCLRAGGGVRILTSANIPGHLTATRAWLDLGPMIHARVSVAGPLFVDVAGGALFNATQDQASFTPNIGVQSVPPFAGRGEAAVGVEFR